MIDEKRIKRFIEGAKESFKEVDNPTFTFPMNILSAYELATNIEELLKKQEAKPMIENERGWNCPSCGMNLIGKTASGYPCDLIDLPEDEPIHFCPMCGQAVKWE